MNQLLRWFEGIEEDVLDAVRKVIIVCLSVLGLAISLLDIGVTLAMEVLSDTINELDGGSE